MHTPAAQVFEEVIAMTHLEEVRVPIIIVVGKRTELRLASFPCPSATRNYFTHPWVLPTARAGGQRNARCFGDHIHLAMRRGMH